MSNSKVAENSNEWINWIEEAISKNHIKYYEYEHFSNIQEIGCGTFGKVHRVNWKNSHRYLVEACIWPYSETRPGPDLKVPVKTPARPGPGLKIHILCRPGPARHYNMKTRARPGPGLVFLICK